MALEFVSQVPVLNVLTPILGLLVLGYYGVEGLRQEDVKKLLTKPMNFFLLLGSLAFLLTLGGKLAGLFSGLKVAVGVVFDLVSVILAGLLGASLIALAGKYIKEISD